MKAACFAAGVLSGPLLMESVAEAQLPQTANPAMLRDPIALLAQRLPANLTSHVQDSMHDDGFVDNLIHSLSSRFLKASPLLDTEHAGATPDRMISRQASSVLGQPYVPDTHRNPLQVNLPSSWARCQPQIRLEPTPVLERGPSASYRHEVPTGETSRDKHTSQFSFIACGTNLPHPEKADKGGEDGWFVRANEHGGGVIALADGVSGFSANGIDSGIYARMLSFKAAQSFKSTMDPKAAIAVAHQETRLLGGATLCVVVLDDTVLRAANIGDSGFRVIRGGEIVFASPALQHFRDCPYQLGFKEFFPQTETADDADEFVFPVELGDLVIVGSDGLFDNVFDVDIAKVATEAAKRGHTSLAAAKAASDALVKLARKNAENTSYESPYALAYSQKEASREMIFDRFLKLFKRRNVGGKMDDITVVVGVVVSTANAFTEVEEAVAISEYLTKSTYTQRQDANNFQEW